jgi:hypothetical protein
MDIAVLAQLLSSLGTLIVASGILYQGRQARKARDDTDRPQIIVDADYTGRFTTNIVVRNIGNGTAKNITFEFSAPLQSTSGYDITELPYFKHGINFMAPQTDLPAVWDSYQNVVKNLRDKGLTEGITITSHYEDRNGEPYQTAWTIKPAATRRQWVLGLQGLRGRGAGPGGPGAGPREDRRRHRRTQVGDGAPSRRTGGVDECAKCSSNTVPRLACANFRELRKGELPRITLPRTPVNRSPP